MNQLVKRTDGAGFTLIELLVVMGVLATLATATILVLNPAQLLAGARDSTRLSDLAALNNALAFFQADQYNLSMGTSSTVYVSVPDSSPTCANLGLPALPGGWTYSCSNSTNYQKVNGSGWISINFSLLSTGSPLSKLPVDPVNTTSTGQYYTYTPGGSWHIAAYLEASKNKMGGGNDKTSTDTGSYPDLYEVGTNLTLLPVSRDSSLVGYWKFDEGTGTNAYDASGHGNNGTLTNGPTWQTSANCVKGGCLSFGGGATNQYINAGTSSMLDISDNFSMVLWIYPHQEISINPRVLRKYTDANNNYQLYSKGINSTSFGAKVMRNGVAYDNMANTVSFSWDAWYHLAVIFRAGVGLAFYVNGVNISNAGALGASVDTNTNFQIATVNGGYFNGVVDNVRIYNRALSAAEIQAIYNSAQ